MKRYLPVAFVVLLAVAAGATWFAFQNPSFVAGLVAIAAHALWIELAPIVFKRMSDDDEKSLAALMRSNPDKYELMRWHKARWKRIRETGK